MENGFDDLYFQERHNVAMALQEVGYRLEEFKVTDGLNEVYISVHAKFIKRESEPFGDNDISF
jgi:hypothetical protein